MNTPLHQEIARLRAEVARLSDPHRAEVQEAAAWRFACGTDCETIAVCELDRNEWIPVLNSRRVLEAVAKELLKQYGPQWTIAGIINKLGEQK